jgi:hypothetical protein
VACIRSAGATKSQKPAPSSQLREHATAAHVDRCARGAGNLGRSRGVIPGNRAPLLFHDRKTISGDIAMARKFDRTPDVTVFLAILLTALVMSAVFTQLRAQTSPGTAPPAAAPIEPATPESAPPITPRTEAEAACRAIGNQEQRTQCLAAITPGGAAPRDTTPPPPAELKRPEPAIPNVAPPAQQSN